MPLQIGVHGGREWGGCISPRQAKSEYVNKTLIW